jgi:hypothetical protein
MSMVGRKWEAQRLLTADEDDVKVKNEREKNLKSSET